jgi:hypothetical protein
LVLLVFAASAAILARLARRASGPWATLGALLLGRADRAGSHVDLRFAAFTAAVAVVLSAVVAFPTTFRLLSPGELTFAVTLALPLVACGLSVTADVALRSLPPVHPTAGDPIDLGALIEGARNEVDEALSRVEDPSRIAALEALTDAVAEYDQVVTDRNGETARHLRKTLDQRLRGVITLARSCVDEERREASNTLGVAADASPDEVDEVYFALRRIYTGAQALAGADPTKLSELTLAYRAIKQCPAVGEAA